MSKDVNGIFKNIYSSLVRKADDPESDLFKEQLDLISSLLKEDMSTADIKKILMEKIIMDRRNTDLYLTPRDRSAINKDIYITHTAVRSFIIKAFVISLAIVTTASGLLLSIEIYRIYNDTGLLNLYIEALKEYIAE